MIEFQPTIRLAALSRSFPTFLEKYNFRIKSGAIILLPNYILFEEQVLNKNYFLSGQELR